MSKAAFLQTSFLGGEFSAYAQGRADDPLYTSALNTCFNSLPVEEGAWVRRPGSAEGGYTRKGLPAKFLAFDFTVALPYDAEFTDGFIRFWSGQRLVLDANPPTILTISTANPAVVETGSANGWSTGDQVMLVVPSGITPIAGLAPLYNRQLQITVIDANHFSIADAVTGATIDGSTIALGTGTFQIGRITTYATPYTNGAWKNARIVQNDTYALVLCTGFAPYVLTNLSPPGTTTSATFSFGLATFLDGPYMDPPTDGSFLTPSAVSGSITLTASSNASINGGLGFQSTDVGRMVRLFSEPAAYNSGTAYTVGQAVKYNGAYYACIVNGTNKQPDISPGYWGLSDSVYNWTWGTITVVTDTSHVQVTIATASVDAAGLPRADGPLFYTNPIYSWRLGAWSGTTGYPDCGTYYDGRFWLAASAIPNVFAGTKTNELFRFDPTGQDGTVADNSGMYETLNSKDKSVPYWMIASHVGLVIGTKTGEWLVQASNINDPITPTSIMARRATKFGAEDILPVETPLAVVFVQRYARKVIEYIADVYSGKFSGTNIGWKAKHLFSAGLAEIAYVQEPTPVVWARDNSGNLLGCTYKRESPFGTQPASFSGWHHHSLGNGRSVVSIASGPSVGGSLDTLAMITKDQNGFYHTEWLTTIFDETAPPEQAWYFDSGVSPTFVQDTTGTGVILYGYANFTGASLGVYCGGLYLGTFTVSATGTITIPYTSTFTAAFLAAESAKAAAGMSFGPSQTQSFITTVTPPPAFAYPTTIQWFANPADSGTNNYLMTVDWKNGLIYGWHNPSNTLMQFGLTNGALLTSQHYVTGTPVGFQGSVGAINWAVYEPLNNNIILTGDIANSIQIFKVSATALGTIVSSYGTNNGLIFDSYPGHLGAPANQCIGVGGGSSFLASHNITQGYMQIIDVGVDPMVYTCANFPRGNFSTSNFSVITPTIQTPALLEFASAIGPETTGLSEPVYVYRTSIWNAAQARSAAVGIWGSSNTYSVGQQAQYKGVIYTSLVNSNTNNQPDTHPVDWQAQTPAGCRDELIATITPAMVDATWTQFLAAWPNQIVCDRTDGNVMFQVVSGAGSPTNTQYLIKVNMVTGAIMWKLALSNMQMPTWESRCAGQELNCTAAGAGPLYPFWSVNTQAGTATLQNVRGTNFAGGELSISDDQRGLLVFQCAFTNDQVSTPHSPVPQNSTPNSFTNSWVVEPMGQGSVTNTITYNSPFVAGYPYTSQGQLLRNIAPDRAGSRTGPALGETRRNHQLAVNLVNTQNLSFGTDFSHLAPANFTLADRVTPLAANVLYSGIYWTPVDDVHSYDGMLCWQANGPYPANVIAIEGFAETQER